MQQKVVNYMRKKLTGIVDTVSAQDHLLVEIERAPGVVCVNCRETIYYLKRIRHGRIEFAPLENGHPVRDDMICPACGRSLCAYMDNKPMIRTDRGWV